MAEVVKTLGHDGKPRYQKRVYAGGKQHMITAKSKSELTAMEKQLFAEYLQGTLVDKKKRLATFAEGWLKDVRRDRALSTYLNYEWHYEKHIKGALGSLLLAELQPWVIQEWLRDLTMEDGASATADKRARCKNTLRACLQTAVQQGLLKVNPCDALDKITVQRKPGRAWTLEQVKYFLAEIEQHPYSIYWQLALLLPCRPSEVRGLRWSAVDLDSATVVIRESRAQYANVTYVGDPKTPTSRRTFEISTDTVAALRRWKAVQSELRLALGRNWRGEDYVCTGPKGGPIGYDGLKASLARLIAATGLPRITLYQMRHTVISVLADAGVSMKVVSELAGHASTRTTQDIYQQTRKGQHKQALAALSKLYAADDGTPENPPQGAGFEPSVVDC